MPIDTTHLNKHNFWRPIIISATTTILISVVLLYIDCLNILTGLFVIPYLSGFITLCFASPLQKRQTLSKIMLPWVSLLVVLLLPIFWKLKVLIILTFPIASLGGWSIGLFIKNAPPH